MLLCSTLLLFSCAKDDAPGQEPDPDEKEHQYQTDVYVAGYESDVAIYWKNGTAVTLTEGSKNADATSIVVVKTSVE